MPHTMNFRVLAACALALSCGEASAQWYATESGQISPNTDEKKSVSGVGGWLLLTDQLEGFLHDWEALPESGAPVVHTIDSVRHGAKVSTLLFYGGCGHGVEPCKATINYRVIRPDGSVYGEQHGLRLSDDR